MSIECLIKNKLAQRITLKKMVPRGFFILDFAFHCEQEGHLPLIFAFIPPPCVLSIAGVW